MTSRGSWQAAEATRPATCARSGAPEATLTAGSSTGNRCTKVIGDCSGRSRRARSSGRSSEPMLAAARVITALYAPGGGASIDRHRPTCRSGESDGHDGSPHIRDLGRRPERTANLAAQLLDVAAVTSPSWCVVRGAASEHPGQWWPGQARRGVADGQRLEECSHLEPGARDEASRVHEGGDVGASGPMCTDASSPVVQRAGRGRCDSRRGSGRRLTAR